MNYFFYTDLAIYYDKIYHYVDYEKQAEFFAKLIKKYVASKNNKILDIACGTGKHANILSESGFDITGLDLSPAMLAGSRKKYPKIQFHQGNMKNWKSGTKFAAIIIFFNSILYNKNRNDLSTTFKNCYSQLQEDGLLIFDTVDKSIGVNSKSKTFKYSDKNSSISFSPQWVYNQNKNLMDLEIDFSINGRNIHDHHEMGAFSFKEQKQLAEVAGFEVLILNRSFDRIKKHTKKDKNAIFLCQKMKH